MALWYIALSLSRGTYLSMFISSFLMVILFQGSHIKCKRRMNEYLKRIFLWISIVIGFFVLVHLIRNVSQSLVNIFSKDEIAFERIEYSNNISDKDVTSVPRTEEPETIDISNKRFAIWNASIKMVMTSPIIGVGNSYTNYHNMSLEEREYFTSHERIMIDYSGGNIHNGYLQILVYCGIVALILYLSFLICSLLKVIIFFRFTKNIYLTNQCIFLFTLVVYLLANNLVETNMALMGANAFQAAFWLFSGYVISLCNITKKKGKL